MDPSDSASLQTKSSVPILRASELSESSGLQRQPIQNCLIEGDCLEALPHLPPESVDLIHTSPPYNINKDYKSSRDDLDHRDYLEFLGGVVGEAYRLLKPGRSFFFQVGYSEREGPGREILPIDVLTFETFRSHGFRLWDRIVWHYFGGMSFTRKFKNTHEIIMWWVKPNGDEDQPLFSVDSVREQSRSFDKRNNLWGRNPGNVWVADRVAYGGHKRATSHIAVYPESITERIIRACSAEGDFVLDPFAGSGTTPAVARSLGRLWLGCELSPEYVREAASRIGMRQVSEWQTLAACLIRLVVFENRRGFASRDEIEDKVGRWLETLQLQDHRDRYEQALSAVRVPDRARGKAAKPQLWAHFDRALSGTMADQETLALASAALDSVFSQRAEWNGLRKYRHLLRLLEEMSRHVRAEGISSVVDSIIESAPSMFEVEPDGLRVRLTANPLRMRMHRGVKRAAAIKVREEQRELF